MSQSTEEPSNQLSEVISRINALTQQSRFKQSPAEGIIPRLTEVYEGDLALDFIEAANPLPVLDDFVNATPRQEHEPLKPAGQPALNETNQSAMTAAQQKRLLREMEPIIKAAVKKAVISELIVIEKALKTTLQQDMMEALKARIESGQY